MRTAITALLIALATAVWADDKWGNANVYDDFPKQREEQLTVQIKRHMAILLYPVDMSSFVRPEKDATFRALIVALQKQMGVPATGILTNGQYSRLSEAARDLEGVPVFLSAAKSVRQSADGKWLLAVGTGAMIGIAFPINITKIFCVRAEGTCEMNAAEFDLKNQMLVFGSPSIYEITTWTAKRVTALREHPCGTATMAIDVVTQAATIASVPHGDLKACSDEPPNVWTLVDSFNAAWKIHQEKANSARNLVYGPAQKFVPRVEDPSSTQR